MAINLYEILEIKKNANFDEIKAAYRRLAMQWHPDRRAESEKHVAEEMFKKIAYAYKVLSDPITRTKYDEELVGAGNNERQHEEAPQSTSPGVSEEEAEKIFFEQFLDLAFELATRGFNEAAIGKALKALDCPDGVARAIAASARKFSSRSYSDTKKNSDSSGNIHREKDSNRIRDINLASWEDAKPYYDAVIRGETTDKYFSDEELDLIKRKIRNLRYLGLKIGVAFSFVCSLLFSLIIRSKSALNTWQFFMVVLSGVLLGCILGYLLGIIFVFVRVKNRDAFQRESKRRKYLNIFELFHKKLPTPAKLSFNSAAFAFPVFWLAYKGMPIFATLTSITFLVVGATVVEWGALHPEFSSNLPMLFWIIPGSIFGAYGNKLYFNKAKKKIKKTMTLPMENALFELRKSGGNRSLSFFIFIAIWAALILLGHYTEKQEREEKRALQVRQQMNLEEIARKNEVKPIFQNDNQLPDDLLARYQELDRQSANFNQQIYDEFFDRKKFYEKNGTPTARALQLAVLDLQVPAGDHHFEQRNLAEEVDGILLDMHYRRVETNNMSSAMFANRLLLENSNLGFGNRKLWSREATMGLEKNQTWFLAKEAFFIRIKNIGHTELTGVIFELSDKGCEDSVNATNRYYLFRFEKSLQREGVSVFTTDLNIEKSHPMWSSTVCGTIVNAW